MLLALLLLACTPDTTDSEDTVDTSAAEQATYRASALVGALDRIHLVRETAELCVALGLVSPPGEPPVALEVPVPWSVEFAWADRRVNADPCWQEAPSEPAWCHDGEGSVTFGDLGEWGYPVTLSVDATLRWPEDRPGWLPESVRLQATEVAVALE